jgi:HAD superfamily hydrolase (TIGR01458 family)
MPTAYKALFLDLSGVLCEGDTPIAGAAEAIERARSRGATLRFLTNTATKSHAEILAHLKRMHMFVQADELFTAPVAARHYIQDRQLKPYCLLHPAIRHDFDDIDQTNPNCVLLGDAREGLNYQSLNRAFQLCMQGAPLIGIGMNKYFMDEHGLQLDAGAFIHALEWAADTRAIIMGKPNKAFFEQIVASTPYTPEQCLMIGDDVISDIQGAADAGLQACLVRTGKYQPKDQQHLPANCGVVDSLINLFKN